MPRIQHHGGVVMMVDNVMEIINIAHQCLLFRYNNRKYLLGLTATLAQDPATTRIKIDHVVLPSLPLHSAHSLFLWHLPALSALNCQNIVVSDSAVRKRLEGLLALLPETEGKPFKWEMMKQHELFEEQLCKIYEEYRSKNLPKPLRVQPHGLAFNDGPQKLNIVVPQYGKSLIVLHQGKVMLLDPGQDIAGTLKYYGIPPTALSAVILTHANSLNIFELLLQPQPITVITSEQVYSQLKKQLKAYFFWDDAMLRLKLRGNIMIEQTKWYRFGSLELSFSEDKCSLMLHLDILFGMKRVRICPQRLLQYPSELVDMKDLELFVVYDMQDPIKKELQCAPAAYRKRVLFNRPTRKLNNKYFLTLSDPAHFITIAAHPYSQAAKHTFDLAFMHRLKDHNYKLQHRRLAHGEKFNAAERTVYLREGYLRDQNQTLHSAQTTINGAKQLRAEGNVSIMHQPARNVSFYTGAKLIDTPHLMTAEDLLKKVKENSFVKTLQRDCGQEKQMALEWEQRVQCGSEWQALNQLASLRTLQAGSDAGKGTSFLLVVKGALRWRSSETVAGRGMGVCNLRKFYSSAYEDGDEVEAVKDSWVIQIPLKDMHSRFFSKYPSRMYQLFSKPPIFQ